MERIGYYCWAGPGTVRMLNLKYFNPKIDINSLMSSYDYDYPAKVKEKFAITDFWATYSWGFSDENEIEDRKFLLDRVDNFHKLGIKLHAYIQGLNLVYEDFKDKNWFCLDEKKRLISYFRGRKVTCLNNPEFREYIRNKILNMYDKGFDGIFMDNIQMGQLGIPTSKDFLPFNFVGCNCEICRAKFKSEYEAPIPLDMEKNLEITKNYLKFRVDSTNAFLKDVASWVHGGKMEFGSNSFDPKFNMNYVYGTDLKEVAQIQDYILFENHSLPSALKSNLYIQDLIEEIDKPVFVVSYKKGIGYDSDFTQSDFNNIYAEDKKLKFYAAIKGSEYVTNGVWHNLNPDDFSSPDVSYQIETIMKTKKNITDMLTRRRPVKFVLKKYYNPLQSWYLESKIGRKSLGVFFSLATH